LVGVPGPLESFRFEERVVSGSQLLSVADVAEALAVHPETVRRLVRRGEVPAVRVGGQVRIPRGFVEGLAAVASSPAAPAAADGGVPGA